MKATIAEIWLPFQQALGIAASRRRQRYVLRTPLYSNSFFLLGNSVFTGVFGFLFWIVAARLYSAEDLGLGSALISAALLLSFLSRFGLGFGIIRFLSHSGVGAQGLITTCFTLSGLAAIVIAIVFLAGLPLLAPRLGFVLENPLLIAAFITFVASGTMFNLLTQVFVAVRRAEFALIQGAIVGLLRLTLVAMMASLFGAFAIVASWGLAVALSLGIGILLFMPRLLPAYVPAPNLRRFGVAREILQFSVSNHVSNGLWRLPSWLLPIMVVNLLGGEANAYFFVGWAMAGHLFQIPIAASLSLFSEGSHNERLLARDVKKALKFIVVLLFPAVVLMLVAADKLLLLFGTEYSKEGSSLVRVLAIAALPLSVNALYLAVGRVKRRLKNIVLVGAVIGLGTLGLGYLLIPTLGIIAVGVAWLASQSLVAVAVLPGIVRLVRSE